MDRKRKLFPPRKPASNRTVATKMIASKDGPTDGRPIVEKIVPSEEDEIRAEEEDVPEEDGRDDEEDAEFATDADADAEILDKKATFESLGLVPELCQACERMGYKNPSKIQVEAIPPALAGRDIIGLAQTGSGKTAAFALPVIQQLLETPQTLFAVALAPTRELALQISKQFEALGSTIGLKCATIVGGADPMQQAIALAKKPHVIVGTPGRVLYHLENTKGFSLKTIKFLILDEADRLLNMDFEEEINKMLQLFPRERHTYLFSATMTQKVEKLQRASLRDPVKVQISTKFQTVDNLIQHYLFIPAAFKDCYLVYLLHEFAGNSVIIFVETKKDCQRLTFLLRNLGLAAVPFHGNLTQSERFGALNKFREGSRTILLATNVAARGLDISSIKLVINYDVPTNAKDYIHRVGRTARGDKSGRSVTLVSQYDVEIYQRIEAMLGKQLDKFPVEEEQALVFLERVNQAQKISALEMREDKKLSKDEKVTTFDDEETENSGKFKKRRSDDSNSNKRGGKSGGRGGGRGRGKRGGKY